MKYFSNICVLHLCWILDLRMFLSESLKIFPIKKFCPLNTETSLTKNASFSLEIFERNILQKIALFSIVYICLIFKVFLLKTTIKCQIVVRFILETFGSSSQGQLNHDVQIFQIDWNVPLKSSEMTSFSEFGGFRISATSFGI
jgi:hypothetical protein